MSDIHQQTRFFADHLKGQNMGQDISGAANLQVILASLPDGVAVFTDDSTTVYINQRTVELLGYTLEEIQGMDPLDLLHPDQKEAISERHRQRLSGQPVETRFETVFRRRDGTDLPVEVTLSRLEWDGSPAVMLLLRDTTEHREFEKVLRQSEADFRALAERANDAISITDSHGVHVFCNQRFLNMLAYTPEEVSHLTRRDIVHPDDAAKLETMREARKRGEKYPEVYELSYRHKDGTALPMEVTAEDFWQLG
jgi:PAS domain S-box-containing protein